MTTYLTFDEFMDSVGGDAEQLRAAFGEAAAARATDDLRPLGGDGPARYPVEALRAWWDEQSWRHLADVLDRWLHTRDSLGDPLAKWAILRRRLVNAAALGQFVQAKVMPRGHAALTADPRLLHGMEQLSGSNPMQVGRFMAGVCQRLYRTPRVVELARAYDRGCVS